MIPIAQPLIGEEEKSLPVHPSLSQGDLETIVQAVNEFTTA